MRNICLPDEISAKIHRIFVCKPRPIKPRSIMRDSVLNLSAPRRDTHRSERLPMTLPDALPANDPKALASLTAACDLYETALMENDLDTLDALFLDSAYTLRFGVGENLYGIEDIRAFRKSRTGGSPQRAVLRREIVTLGPELGLCNLAFQRDGSPRIGRQSQTWVNTPTGWRVISAHVSLMADQS